MSAQDVSSTEAKPFFPEIHTLCDSCNKDFLVGREAWGETADKFTSLFQRCPHCGYPNKRWLSMLKVDVVSLSEFVGLQNRLEGIRQQTKNIENAFVDHLVATAVLDAFVDHLVATDILVEDTLSDSEVALMDAILGLGVLVSEPRTKITQKR